MKMYENIRNPSFEGPNKMFRETLKNKDSYIWGLLVNTGANRGGYTRYRF